MLDANPPSLIDGAPGVLVRIINDLGRETITGVGAASDRRGRAVGFAKPEMPPLSTITPTSPLRLAVAAKIAFPDGSMSVSALRRMGTSGLLTIERMAGKDFTTLADIEEMRKSCRVQAKAPDFISKRVATDSPYGSSATVSGKSAQDALKATASQLRESLRPTSARSTTRRKTGAVTLPKSE